MHSLYRFYNSINQKIRTKLSSLYPSRQEDISLIYPVVDANRFTTMQDNLVSSEISKLKDTFNIQESDFVVSMIARMSDQKNPLRLLRLAKEIKNNDLNHIVFDDRFWRSRSEINSFIKRNSIKNVIRTGFREDISLLHKAMLLFYFQTMKDFRSQFLKH